MAHQLAALVVDDDELVRETIAHQLRSAGAAVIEAAEDGTRARAALGRGTPFDLIICDLMLPEIDGIEFLREAAQTLPSAALVLISAADERILRSVAVLARERGMRVLGALRKPVRQLIERLDLVVPAEPPMNYLGPADVLRGMESGGIGAQVQPKLRAADHTLHSAELLMRWTDRARGPVAPRDLLLAAEKAGMTHTLTEYMLELALRCSAAWKRGGHSIPIAVNLTGAALRRLDLPDRVSRLLGDANVEPAMLTIEVSEASLGNDPALLDVLSRLSIRGVRVTLDHYGTGYGSLVRLQRLPITEVKIDRSFVRCLGSGKVAETIIEYSIKMARALELETVAVGVENETQAEALKAMGCDVLQGLYVSPPLPPEELPGWRWARPQAAVTPPSAEPAVCTPAAVA
jgi:EAL domain-containing protein (putative c-di-GMP-specific phosphodiesterase class I)